jgi:hypothetical protein
VTERQLRKKAPSWAAASKYDTFEECDTCPKMEVVPAGEFTFECGGTVILVIGKAKFK